MPSDDFKNIPSNVLEPREISLIFLATLTLFLFFIFFGSFLHDTLLLAVGETIMILPALVYVLYRRLPLLKTFRLQRTSLSQIMATALLFIPVFILADELDRVIQQFFPMPAEWSDSMIELLQFKTVPEAAMILFAGVLCAALFEEMLFRGLLQHTLEYYREPAIAIVLTSVLFALVHFNPWTAIQVTSLGLVLGFVAWKSGSILPSIVLHALNNLASLILMNSQEGFLNLYTTSHHVKFIWIVAAIVFVIPAARLFSKTCFEKNQHF